MKCTMHHNPSSFYFVNFEYQARAVTVARSSPLYAFTAGDVPNTLLQLDLVEQNKCLDLNLFI